MEACVLAERWRPYVVLSGHKKVLLLFCPTIKTAPNRSIASQIASSLPRIMAHVHLDFSSARTGCSPGSEEPAIGRGIVPTRRAEGSVYYGLSRSYRNHRADSAAGIRVGPAEWLGGLALGHRQHQTSAENVAGRQGLRLRPTGQFLTMLFAQFRRSMIASRTTPRSSGYEMTGTVH
jgi:hypothetical protein